MIPSKRRNGRQYLRLQMTQIAARLLADQECLDFQSARRKAAARVGCRDQRLFPENSEIDHALKEYQQLFKQESQSKSLKHLRQLAIEAMSDMAAFAPRLVGRVLTGTADINTPIRLYVYSESPDEIVHYLLERRIPYAQREFQARFPGGGTKPLPMFEFRAGDVVFELIGLRRADQANPPLSPLNDEPDPGAPLKRVRSLLS